MEEWEVEEIGDIGSVVDAEDGAVVLKKMLSDSFVVGVDEFEQHNLCFRCKGRVEPPANTNDSGKCSRAECGMLQLYSECNDQVSAKLVFKGGDDRGTVLLTVYGKLLKEMPGVSEDGNVSQSTMVHIRLASVTNTPGPQNIITAFAVKGKQ